MNKIVITGSSGFLGSNLINKLKDDNRYFVYALSTKANELEKINTSSNICYYNKNIIFNEQCQEIIDNSIIINCAFPRNSTAEEIANGLKYIQTLFIIANKYSAKAVINISSQSIYSSERIDAAKETTQISLETTYAIGKYATELMLKCACEKISYTNIRLASLIGTEFNQRIVNRLLKKALQTHSIQIKDNEQRFGFLDIKDAVDGICKVLESNIKQWKTEYNLGCKYAYSLMNIAEVIKEVLKETEEIDIQIEKMPGNEHSNSAVDASLFYSDFQFIPKISLKDSIIEIKNNLLGKVLE